ncbi:MAG: hypothetical protein F6K09_20165 [Merismopedia sp. SIO2A8]|nr:hypothetical protein [Merismopedia sp. SIO2A8]
MSWMFELPLAIASWIFFRVMKIVIGNLYTLFLLVNRNKTTQWRVLSPEVLTATLSLPVLMTKGPRWNTHAIIGTVGPIKVERHLALDLATIQSSAGSWTAAIYSYPGYQTVGNLGSLQVVDPSAAWESIELASGYYTVGLRYYDRHDTVIMPAIQIDGTEVVPAQGIDPSVNKVYETLKSRETWFYRSLHYYIFTILQWRQHLPDGWIRSEFLPVGAPETQFEYGAIAQGQTLSITMAKLLLDNYNIYYTLYNRASFPIEWSQLRNSPYTASPVQCDGFYLLRIRPKHPNVPKFEAEWLTIATQS